MTVKRISLVLLGLFALVGGVLLFVFMRSDFYSKLGINANRDIEEAQKKPAVKIGPNDNRAPQDVIQGSGPATVFREDKKSAEYYSADRKLVATDHFDEGGRLVRRDFYDGEGRIRLRQFYNSAGKVIREEAFNENRAKIKRRQYFPVGPGRPVY